MMFHALVLSLFFLSVSANFVVEEECLNYTVYPVQYEITITPYFGKKTSYSGDIIITVIANAPNIQVIELDVRELNVFAGTIQVFDGSRNIVNFARPYEYDSKKGKLFIYLSEPLKLYKDYKQFYYIRMSFEKYLTEKTEGVFYGSYYDVNGNQKKMLVTRLSPNHAMYFFPCLYNPKFEAVFKFHVNVVPGENRFQYINTSLTISQEERRKKNNSITVIDYKPSPQVSLHQVAFHFSQFSREAMTSDNAMDTLVIFAPQQEIQIYINILEYGKEIIDEIHRYSSVKRPLTNGPINIIPVISETNYRVRDFEIDSWNILTNGAYKLAYIPGVTSARQVERIRFELARQLSRIWLGNPGEIYRTRWREEWFKEGVATYLAFFFMTQHTNRRDKELFYLYTLDAKHKAMMEDWHSSTPALDVFDSTLAIEIPSRYRNLVDMKTVSLLWMVENWIGSEKFHMAFVKYINTRLNQKGKYISMKDFLASVDSDTVECQHQFFNGSTASNILKSWFQQPGYPVIDVEVLRDRTPNAITLKQRHFDFTRHNRRESNYMIPISYVVEKNENCVNCHRPRFTIGKQIYSFEENLNGGWILLNRNASGYYRVNYDEQTWRRIAASLKENPNAIDAMMRAQIVNDAFALYAAGDIHLGLAFEILDYLELEENPIVWASVMSGFELLRIDGAACDMTKSLYGAWEDFLQRKISPMYKKWSNMKIDTSSTSATVLQQRLARSNVISFACELKHPQCLADLRWLYGSAGQQMPRVNCDIREAFFYLLYSEDLSFGTRKLSPLEEEDRYTAHRRLLQKEEFLRKAPKGGPLAIPIIRTTTTTTTTTESTPTVPGSASANTISLLNELIILYLLFYLQDKLNI